MSEVRVSVKAIIVAEGKVLALKCRDDEGDWFMLPGGGQAYGETIHQALERECLEEAGCQVRVGTLRFVRDYIAKNHEFADSSGDFHQVELWFECELVSEPGTPIVPDTMQVGVEWLEIDRLDTHRIYPKILQDGLLAKASTTAIYLGDVN